jgi:zinc transporter, ZIP family
MSSTTLPWRRIFIRHALDHPWTSLGFSISILGLVVMILETIRKVIFLEDALPHFDYALLGGFVGFGSTFLGALPAYFKEEIKEKTQNIMLGWAAGMMLSAATFSLLIPGLESGREIMGNSLIGTGIVVLGMTLGVLLMLGMDHFMPHEHESVGGCGAGHERCNRVWLFVLAIAIHNLPEGMAIGVGLSQGDLNVGIPLTTAIALQNLPEGLAVAVSLRAIGLSPMRSVLIAGLTGIMEILGAILGVGIVGGVDFAYPLGLGLAAGAMIFVVSHEVIPETHRNGNQTSSTIGLMVGFVMMMVLDTLLV